MDLSLCSSVSSVVRVLSQILYRPEIVRKPRIAFPIFVEDNQLGSRLAPEPS